MGRPPCDKPCQRTVWFENIDFFHRIPRLESKGGSWAYFSPGAGFTADDGRFRTGPNGGFVDSHVYTLSYGPIAVPELDHNKFLMTSRIYAPVPRRGELVIDWKGTGQTFGTGLNPFGEEVTHSNDPRLAASGFVANDPDNGTFFNFLFTNDRVYIVYGRQPYLRLALGQTYAAFTYMIPVKVRDRKDLHRCRLVFNQERREVKWYVDYQLVFRLGNVGARLMKRTYLTSDKGGMDVESFPRQIEYGFGTFDFLDQYPVCYRSECSHGCWYPKNAIGLVDLGDGLALPAFNTFLGEPSPATYWDPLALPENRLWGQGAELRIFQLTVFQQLPAA